jgi:antitoxin VapB
MVTLAPETEQIARLVALKSGKAIDVVLRDALESHALAGGVLSRRSRRPVDAKAVAAIIERIASRPVLDPRPDDEIIGYDAFGIPG